MPIRKIPNILALRKRQQEKRKAELNKKKMKELKKKRKKIFERPDPRNVSAFEKI